MEPTITIVSGGCAAVSKQASVNSVQALPGGHKIELLKFPLGCYELDRDEKLGLVLADCREGKSHLDGMFFFTSVHSANVYSIGSEQAVLTIPLSRDWKDVTGLLASVNSGKYVILVKRGNFIEVHRLK